MLPLQGTEVRSLVGEIRLCIPHGAAKKKKKDKRERKAFLFFFFFPFISISWRLITLQYCSGFCHTLT